MFLKGREDSKARAPGENRAVFYNAREYFISGSGERVNGLALMHVCPPFSHIHVTARDDYSYVSIVFVFDEKDELCAHSIYKSEINGSNDVFRPHLMR